jgi:hypothetical protein
MPLHLWIAASVPAFACSCAVAATAMAAANATAPAAGHRMPPPCHHAPHGQPPATVTAASALGKPATPAQLLPPAPLQRMCRRQPQPPPQRTMLPAAVLLPVMLPQPSSPQLPLPQPPRELPQRKRPPPQLRPRMLPLPPAMPPPFPQPLLPRPPLANHTAEHGTSPAAVAAPCLGSKPPAPKPLPSATCASNAQRTANSSMSALASTFGAVDARDPRYARAPPASDKPEDFAKQVAQARTQRHMCYLTQTLPHHQRNQPPLHRHLSPPRRARRRPLAPSRGNPPSSSPRSSHHRMMRSSSSYSNRPALNSKVFSAPSKRCRLFARLCRCCGCHAQCVPLWQPPSASSCSQPRA